MLQGDVHRFYFRLRRRWPIPPAGAISDLDHVREIADYYARINPRERSLLLSWAKKEESGIGLIPAALSGIPLLGLLFAPFIQAPIKQMAPWAWMVLWAAGAMAFVVGIYIHHRQKAYTALHIHILEHMEDHEPLSLKDGRPQARWGQRALQGARTPPAPPEPELPLQSKGPEH